MNVNNFSALNLDDTIESLKSVNEKLNQLKKENPAIGKSVAAAMQELNQVTKKLNKFHGLLGKVFKALKPAEFKKLSAIKASYIQFPTKHGAYQKLREQQGLLHGQLNELMIKKSPAELEVRSNHEAQQPKKVKGYADKIWSDFKAGRIMSQNGKVITQKKFLVLYLHPDKYDTQVIREKLTGYGIHSKKLAEAIFKELQNKE